MNVKKRVAHRLAWPGVLLVLLVAVVVLPIVAQDPGADAKSGAAQTGVQPVDSADNEPFQSDRNIGGGLQPLSGTVTVKENEERLRKGRTLRQVAEPSPAKAPSRVFPPLPKEASWTMQWDHKVDGNIAHNSYYELRLSFRNDKVTGRIVKTPDGRSSVTLDDIA